MPLVLFYDNELYPTATEVSFVVDSSSGKYVGVFSIAEKKFKGSRNIVYDALGVMLMLVTVS